MPKSEPSPSRSNPASVFFIGKDSRGSWVVQDQRGLCGGLFVNRAEALRYALFENGRQPQAVVMVPGVLELDINRKPSAVHPSETKADISSYRRAA